LTPSEGHKKIEKLADHLFRHEAGKMIAVLTRLFGFHNANMVEDVVQDAFAKALNEWRFKMPDNPSGWLIQVAKNKAIDIVRRQRYQHEFAAEMSSLLKSEYTASPVIENMFLDHEVQDSQLRMIFACCHPSLDAEDQIAITLKTCSGFSVTEIASGLLSNPETIKKRLQRARSFLVGNNIRLEIPNGHELKNRLDVVLQTLYLLFNEGYNSSSREELIRKDLCQESLRLALLLTKHSLIQTPKCFSLVALMSLLASRFEARVNGDSEIILLEDQDRSKWNADLINLGLGYLNKAMQGDEVSEYHLQAAIVAEHSITSTFLTTNWERILGLYDMLTLQNNSPVVLLNRAIVVAKINGPASGIDEVNKIPAIERLIDSHYLFPAVLGELNKQNGDQERALSFFIRAEALTNSPAEKKLLKSKINNLKRLS
jgi:RNA polymerase sigma factor (sigma-70 family)